jgi:rhodanese-related sulfurtransferase
MSLIIKIFYWYVIIICSMELALSQGNDFLFDSMISTLCKGTIPTIQVDELESIDLERPNIHIWDTREKKEFEVSHILNAEWVGYDSFSKRSMKDLGREDTIIVYCSVGYRSEKIGEKLASAGFKNVWNLYGGIFQWKNSGHTVYDSDGKMTEKVHAYDKSWGIWLKNGIKVYE